MRTPLRTGSALLAVWVAAVAATLAIAHYTKIGQVLVEVSQRHGIHEGDVLAGVLLAGFAVVASIMILRSEPD